MTTYKHPKTGRVLRVGQLVHIDANARLGPTAMGMFKVTGFTDEGVLVVPTSDPFVNRQLRIHPSDIK
jgi:hypothetical protein